VELEDRELDRAYRLAGLILGDAREAEDAVSEAIERAWERGEQLRDPTGFQAWFDRILVNECRDRLRRRSKIRFIELAASAGATSVDPFRHVLEQDELLRVVAALPDEERLPIVLRYWADLSLRTIAERLSWPLGTVKSRLHRALGRLREALENLQGTAAQ